jgi:hypothetical protein
MSNLLKEAIADAKTVRETAIANAKMALEEAFTPHLKSMLSAKLAEDEVEEGFEDEITAEEMDDEDEEMDEMGGKSYREDDDEDMEEMMHDKNRREDDDEEMEEGEHDEEDEDMDEGIIEINGVKYAPITEEEDEDEDEDEMREEDNLDLEAVIKELETEIAEAEESDEDSVNEAGHEDDEKDEVDEEIVVEEEDDDDEDKMDEQSKSSGIGGGDNKVNMASAGDEEDPDKGKEMKESVNAMQKELNEYKEAVTFLREKLHEVNILNAKLLYTNRLFKEYVLSNGQKLKIVETFDRAQTTREIKLVYSTLAESFKNGEIKKNRVQESASTKTGTTKPTQKIITEESQVADRFKKLAGIL